MPSNRILVDSSYLFAFFDGENKRHEDALLVAKVFQGQFVVPYVVLTEVAYLFKREGGVPAVLKFLDGLSVMRPQLEIVTPADLTRSRDIMAQYADAKLDFVDCCIMALSERMNIVQVCTLDHRDFSIFRPKHVNHLELLP